MKILIAPDSFKGSVTAKEAAEAIKKGIHNVRPDTDVQLVPMADGGEGTMIGLVEATQGSIHEVNVEDPLGRHLVAQYGVTGEGKTAIIELASASGLHTLTKEELDPQVASTYGTGLLIVDALNRGLRNFIICLGGSATNDGGTGMLKALGCRFLDEYGEELVSGGLALKNLNRIDESHSDPRIFETTFQVACDVNNPLIGTNGATAVFGSQKGATPKMVEQLDGALRRFADCTQQQTGRTIHSFPGGGAAGGAAAGLQAFLNAELKTGIKLVIEALHLEDILQREDFDVLFTGEGKIDSQTASGKVVAGLSELAQQHDIPAIAIGGSVEGSLSDLHKIGLTAAFSITDRPMVLEEAIENGRTLIEKQSEQIFRLISASIAERCSDEA